MANSKSPLKTSLPLPWVTLLLYVAFGPFCNSPSTGWSASRLAMLLCSTRAKHLRSPLWVSLRPGIGEWS